MPDFAPQVFDAGTAQAEVAEFQALLSANPALKEIAFRDFFRSRPHASALIGYYNLKVKRIDLLAYEYPLFGDFRCDLVIADSVTRACTFVEFEDAGPRSLFVKHGDKTTREWSPRIDHGYPQLIDWFYKLQDMTNTASMEARFGKRAIDYTGLLVVGRDQYLNDGEHDRLRWRREHVIVNSKQIICVNYDELLEDLILHLDRHGPLIPVAG